MHVIRDQFTFHKGRFFNKFNLVKALCVHFISNESCIVAVITNNDRNTRLPVFYNVSLPLCSSDKNEKFLLENSAKSWPER